MRVGVIGVRHASDALVTRLLQGGHSVAVYTGTRDSGNATTAPGGARQADTLADVCRGADVVLSHLHDDAMLLEVAQGANGVIASITGDTIHVALGLHRAKTIAQLGAAHAARDLRFVAAPVLLAAAVDVGETVVAAGPQAAVDALAPFFQALGLRVFPAGEKPEAASILALVHAGLVACAVEAMAEAFALVRKYGVDLHVMHDVITDGLFAGSDVYRRYGASLIDGAPGDGIDVTAARALQILDLVMAAADDAKVPLPSVDACRDRLLGAMAHGGGEYRWTVLNREQARASGLD